MACAVMSYVVGSCMGMAKVVMAYTVWTKPRYGSDALLTKMPRYGSDDGAPAINCTGPSYAGPNYTGHYPIGHNRIGHGYIQATTIVEVLPPDLCLDPPAVKAITT